MTSKELVKKWFSIWENGDFRNIPVSDNFKHTSPYGTIESKKSYLELVAANEDKFLGNQFEILDEIFETDRACVRYIVSKGDFSMAVSEWHFIKDGCIEEIVAYYNIEGAINEDRKLKNL